LFDTKRIWEVSSMETDEITGAVIDVAVQAHRVFGPCLLESLYESVLACELRRRGLSTDRQRLIKISYDGIDSEDAFRADLIVEERVIVEVKSVDRLARVHAKQLLTYLRLTNLRVGLLLNFGAETMKEGIERVVNNYTPSRFALLRVDKPRDETSLSPRPSLETLQSGAPISPRIHNHQ
jgi:GxxExxY protein